MEKYNIDRQIRDFKNKTNISIYKPLNSNKFGINWPAYGTVSIIDAKKFLRNLEKAIKFATKLNKK